MEKMRGKTIAIIMILGLLSQSLVVSYGAINDSPIYENEMDVFIKLKSSAEARRDEFLYLFEEDLPFEIMENLQYALQTLHEAEELFDSDPRESSRLYLGVLKGFRITWEMYVDYNPEAPEQSFSEPPAETPPVVNNDDQTEEIIKTKGNLLNRFIVKVSTKLNLIQEDVEEREDEMSDDGSITLTNVIKEMHETIVHIGELIETGSMEVAIVALGEASLEVEKVIPELIDEEIEEAAAAEAHKAEKAAKKAQKKAEREAKKAEKEADKVEEAAEEAQEEKEDDKEEKEDEKDK